MTFLSVMALVLTSSRPTGSFVIPLAGAAHSARLQTNHAVERIDEDQNSPARVHTKHHTEAQLKDKTPSKISQLDTRDVFIKLQLDAADGLAFAGRVVDTLEDMALHFRRQWEPVAKDKLGLRNAIASLGRKPRIVVLGCGWGGHALAKVIDDAKFEVIVISPRNYFLFTPLLAASAVGTVDSASITESIKQANPHVLYVQGTVTTVDHTAHRLTVKVATSLNESGNTAFEPVELEYSKLVYAVGSKTGTFGIPGVLEHCYFLKEVADAQRLRRALLSRFDEASFPGACEHEKRRLLSFVIIGSGPTGIEFSGELSDLLAHDVKRLFPELTPYVTLKVVSSSNTILPMFETILQERGLTTLAQEGVDVMLNQRVSRICKDSIELQSGETISYGLCFWAGGTEARSLTRALIESVPGQAEAEGAKRGQLTVDGYMRVKGVADSSVLGIGDAVRVEGHSYPTTGQVAAQEGAYVARLLNRDYLLDRLKPQAASAADATARQWDWHASINLLGDWIWLRGALTARPFHFLNLGTLAYLGSGAGLAQIEGGDRSRIMDASGTVGFLLWRSTYFVKQVSVRNRVCVLIDWVKAAAFGRDFSTTDYNPGDDT